PRERLTVQLVFGRWPASAAALAGWCQSPHHSRLRHLVFLPQRGCRRSSSGQKHLASRLLFPVDLPPVPVPRRGFRLFSTSALVALARSMGQLSERTAALPLRRR